MWRKTNRQCRYTTLCLYGVQCVETHRQTIQTYNVVCVFGGVCEETQTEGGETQTECGERQTDNTDSIEWLRLVGSLKL